MLLLKIKDVEELKKKTMGDDVLVVCTLCSNWNFSKDKIEGMARELGAEIVNTSMLCNRPDLKIDGKGAVFVLACGAGVQVVGDALNKGVIPVADTLGIGVKNEDGSIVNYCIVCGDCIVDETASICPRTRCEKSLLNGPCAGVHDGLCELSTKDNPIKCGWNEICMRMVANNETDKFIEMRMPKVKR